MTDRYDADQLERDLNATVVMYRRWLNHRDEWDGLDGERRGRLRKLTDEVAQVVQELTATPEQGTEDEFGGTVETGDGTSFETNAYFEEGQLVVADDDDEEWVVDLDHIRRHEANPGIMFPDNDGSLLSFFPSQPDAFYEALEGARKG
jgi:hypothetical protein